MEVKSNSVEMEQQPTLSRGTLEAVREYYLSQAECTDLDHEKEVTRRLRTAFSELGGRSQFLNSSLMMSLKEKLDS